MWHLRVAAAVRRPLAVAGAALLFLSVLPSGSRADAMSPRVLPSLDNATKRKLVATLRRGNERGNRADVFAKVGDSISRSPAFLQGLGCGQWSPRVDRRLGFTVSYFATRPLRGSSSDCGPVNSFSRDSAATRAFALSDWPLQPGANVDPACHSGETPLACEIRLDRPAYAVILFGTNDVTIGQLFGSDPLPAYISNMGRIVATARRLGVVPILTTVPPRIDSAAEASTEGLNVGLRQLASQRHVPLIDLWTVLNPLPNRGLSADNLHPSLYRGPDCTALCDPKTCAPGCQAANFTPAGLQYGYDARNLITLRALGRLFHFAQSVGP